MVIGKKECQIGLHRLDCLDLLQFVVLTISLEYYFNNVLFHVIGTKKEDKTLSEEKIIQTGILKVGVGNVRALC